MTGQLSFRGFLSAASAIAVICGLAIPVSAQTLLVDLGTPNAFRSVAVPNPDNNGNYWNSINSHQLWENLIDIDGNATPIDFGFSSANGEDSFNGPAGVTSNPPTAGEIAATDIDAGALGNLGGANEAAMDYYVTSTFQIQALDLAKTYDLTFFGSHKFNNDNTTRYTIYTDGTFSTPVTSADLLVGVDNDHNRDAVAAISGVAPQADSIIYVGFSGANGGDGYLNAMQIVGVPEPNSLLLAASAVGLAFGFRRR